MRIAIFGLGYVGFTAMCCITSEGHEVLGFDIDEEKVRAINSGTPPIVEPKVDQLLAQAHSNGLVSAYTDCDSHLDECDIAIVCVGTPSGSDGSLDMSQIINVSRQIATSMKKRRSNPLTVVYRSTFPPGTTEDLVAPIFQTVLGRESGRLVELAYNPEFLRETSAVDDYFAPPRIVIGTRDGKPNRQLEILYRNIDTPTFYTGFREAEFIKMVDNAWHALKVTFANEVGRVCVQQGISARSIHKMFIADTKLNISPYYLRPGSPFGGSCLPKDVRAFQSMAMQDAVKAHVLDAILRSNEEHKRWLFEFATRDLEPFATILLVGLAFKAHTDDMRESPNLDLVRDLVDNGYRVSVYDPMIDPRKLVGANLRYALEKVPELHDLFVSRETAEASRYDRVIVANDSIQQLSLNSDLNVIDVRALP